MKEWEGLSPEYRQLLEELADLEHKQWWAWTLAIEHKLPEKITKHWKKNWKPYDELPEFEKDKDRLWAMNVFSILEKGLPKCRWCGHDPSS